MDYKPYSIEWSRKRYLNEAIQKYFDSGVDAEIIIDDILDCLNDSILFHKTRLEKVEFIMNAIGELRNDSV